MTILVTGVPGNVGTPLVRALLAAGAPVRVAAMDPARAGVALLGGDDGLEVVRFAFTDPATRPGAFAGIERVFLLRPPQLSRGRRDLLPALEAAAAAGSATWSSSPSRGRAQPAGAASGRRGPPARLADGLDVRPGRLPPAEPVHHPRPRDPRTGGDMGPGRPWSNGLRGRPRRGRCLPPWPERSRSRGRRLHPDRSGGRHLRHLHHCPPRPGLRPCRRRSRPHRPATSGHPRIRPRLRRAWRPAAFSIP
jgi:hypothetical protein